MATFKKQPSGNWRARVRSQGVSKSRTFATKAQAQAWAAATEQEAQGFGGVLPSKTIKDAFERYANEVSTKKRGERWEIVRLKKLAKSIGEDRLLSSLKTPDFVKWRDEALGKVSGATVRREMNLLSAVFSTCVTEWEWLHASPIKGCKQPQDSPHRTRRITEDEEQKIRLVLGEEEDRPAETKMQQVGVGFQLAIETAMRQGEILSLTTQLVDLVRKTAFLPLTKNGTSRTVPLSDRAVELLKLLTPGDNGKFFTVPPASFEALFRKAKDMAGVDGLHFHDTRREATSRLSKKVDVLTLAKITGHKDLRKLLIYYEEDMSEVAKRI